MDTHSDVDHDPEQFRYPPTVGGTAEVAESTGVDSMRKQVEEDIAHETGSESPSDNLMQARAGVDSAYLPLPEKPQIQAVEIITEPTPTECLQEGILIGQFRDAKEARS